MGLWAVPCVQLRWWVASTDQGPSVASEETWAPMSTWSEEEEHEAGERGAQLGRFGLTHSLISRHTRTRVHTNTRACRSACTGEMCFFSAAVLLASDQIRAAGSRGMEHAGISACVTGVRKQELVGRTSRWKPVPPLPSCLPFNKLISLSHLPLLHLINTVPTCVGRGVGRMDCDGTSYIVVAITSFIRPSSPEPCLCARPCDPGWGGESRNA